MYIAKSVNYCNVLNLNCFTTLTAKAPFSMSIVCNNNVNFKTEIIIDFDSPHLGEYVGVNKCMLEEEELKNFYNFFHV